MNAVFTGGGTGGHLYPAIAIADALRARGNGRLEFIGTADRLEATIVPKAGYALHTVKSAPLRRKFSMQFPRTIAANACGVVQSAAILSRLQPEIVIATGGYVCFPVVLAARFLNAVRRLHAKIVLLEPNAKPGLTNRLLAPLVDEVWGAFPVGDARFHAKYVHTGIPVRASFKNLDVRAHALARFGLSPSRSTLLAIGGSQGARSINDALTSLVKSEGLPQGWQLIHITGEREYDRVRESLGREEPAVRPYL
ncbi:MAG: glycosyltransferase, partial [Candidatus Eremiobacteraeota bacterium]|nr:glycosyltransferase [Candidatus Eremiobacteraeota bacterium]